MNPRPQHFPIVLVTCLAFGGSLATQDPGSAAQSDTRTRIDAAVEAAQARDKRVVLAWTAGPEAGDALAKAAAATEVRGQPFRYEYEWLTVDVRRPENSAMAAVYRAGDARPWLTVLDGVGRPIAQQDASGWMRTTGIDTDALATFLDANKVPMPDAEDVLAEGVARAKATNRNVLVHLAAPW